MKLLVVLLWLGHLQADKGKGACIMGWLKEYDVSSVWAGLAVPGFGGSALGQVVFCSRMILVGSTRVCRR